MIAAHSSGTVVLFHVSLVLVGEGTHGADHGIRSGLPKPAQAGIPQQIAKLVQHRKIRSGGSKLRDGLKNAVHLVSADAAWHALAAGLGHAEVHEVSRHVDHARTFIHDDHAARAHDGTGLRQRLVVHRHVEEVPREDNHRTGHPSARL